MCSQGRPICFFWVKFWFELETSQWPGAMWSCDQTPLEGELEYCYTKETISNQIVPTFGYCISTKCRKNVITFCLFIFNFINVWREYRGDCIHNYIEIVIDKFYWGTHSNCNEDYVVVMGAYASASLPGGGSMDDLLCLVSLHVLSEHENGSEDSMGYCHYGVCLHHL